MSEADWDAPRTEEGLQWVLKRVAECRAEGDWVQVGNGLLELSWLVKWVRSDTEQQPFQRSHELALEALDTFRRAGDRKGELRALIAASALADLKRREGKLAEADAIARALADEGSMALVWAARARVLAMSDPVKSAELNRRAIESFRRAGNLRGQAQCLFGLSISEGDSLKKRDYALEAASLFRAIGDPEEASRCMTIALMNAEEIQPLPELEDLARQGLKDALQAGHRGQEGVFYHKLALIALAKGDRAEAERFQRWADDVKESDGLTPHERWEEEVEGLKMMVDMAQAQGNQEAEQMFSEELKRLEKAKPRR